MNTLLIGTSNRGKFKEIKKFLTDLPVRIISLSDLHISSYPLETGNSFQENAVIKAKYYCQVSGLPTLADDGGFEIDALGGEPGVKSHRWIDPARESTDKELISYTIKKMKDIPDGKRGAQLRLVLAFATPDGKVVTAEGRRRGIVPVKPEGARRAGFPYRTLLFLPQIGKYYDHEQLTEAESRKYNHRRKALEKIKPFIRDYFAI